MLKFHFGSLVHSKMTFLEEGPSDERSEGWESEQNHLGPNPAWSAGSVAGMLIPLHPINKEQG